MKREIREETVSVDQRSRWKVCHGLEKIWKGGGAGLLKITTPANRGFFSTLGNIHVFALAWTHRLEQVLAFNMNPKRAMCC